MKIMIPSFGSGGYQVAAINARKTVNLPKMTHYVNPQTVVRATSKADLFLHKFEIWKQALKKNNDEIFVHLDADASFTKFFDPVLLEKSLGQFSLGMVEQPRVLGDNPLGRKDLYEHYLSVAHAAVAPQGRKPSIQNFRYFNTGFVVFRRQGLENFLNWAEDKLPYIPREIGGHMVADQDIMQVYANEVAPNEVAQLDWSWNHCEWWDEDFPNPTARVIHMSNFCQGPLASQMNRRAVLCEANDAKDFSDLTVVGVIHNSNGVISECVDTLLEIPGIKILVVDNASTTSPILPSTNRIKVLQNKKNLGFSKAVNVGIREAQTKYLCLLNPDAFLTYEATKEAIARLEVDANQLLAPDFYDSLGNLIESRRQGYTLQRLIDDLVPQTNTFRRKLLDLAIPDRSGAEFQWLIGACIFSSKKFLLEVGGLDETYFLYMEDVELGKEASKRGGVSSLNTAIEHLGSGSTDKSAKFKSIELATARLKYLKRHFGTYPWFLTMLLGGYAFVGLSKRED